MNYLPPEVLTLKLKMHTASHNSTYNIQPILCMLFSKFPLSLGLATLNVIFHLLAFILLRLACWCGAVA